MLNRLKLITNAATLREPAYCNQKQAVHMYCLFFIYLKRCKGMVDKCSGQEKKVFICSGFIYLWEASFWEYLS